MDNSMTENFLQNLQTISVKWIAEQIPGGFFIYFTDASQKILYVNSAMLRIFGCQTEQEFYSLTGGSIYRAETSAGYRFCTAFD